MALLGKGVSMADRLRRPQRLNAFVKPSFILPRWARGATLSAVVKGVQRLIPSPLVVKQHSHARENARRQRQIAKGMLKVSG